ncbi:MAG: DUF1385 domain-containing protein, partial [Dehalococcoidia bacterium]|nr:DUF1385 domain-containing protein [Dehalococcoidia bacterium]
GGVMIRGRNSTSIAVRRMDGGIEVSARPLATLYKGKWREVPLIRGVIVLIETVVLGTGALMYSAQVSTETEQEKITPGMIWGSLIMGVALAVALFFILPLLLARLLDPFIASAFLSNIIEGVIRIILFIVYLAAIGRMKDIREIFAYHGAEHMSVNAYEAGAPLEVADVMKYSTAHTRCGTSFLLVVLVLAIAVFALLGRPPIWISIASRILLLPVIAALSYELIKFEAGYSHNRLIHWLLMPGLWLQAMTTRRPTGSQVEVAIAAMRKALESDGVALNA